MKKVLSVLIAVMMIASLTVIANANGWNAADGCKTTHEIFKADPSVVAKDGVIAAGEYREIEIDRNPDTSDLMLTFTSSSAYAKAEELLGNVHFYMSWDEVNGLNVAVVSPLSETPVCKESQPDDYQDQFLFCYGMMFRASDPNWTASDFPGEVIYRGISKNTETGELLCGTYGIEGYTGKVETPFSITINGQVVTYEISFPIESLVRAENLNGKCPVDGTKLSYDLSAVGGNGTGFSDDGQDSYAVSLGDGGYMSVAKQIGDASTAFGTFTSAPVVETGSTDTEPNPGPNPTPNPNPGPNPTPNPDNGNGTPTNDNPSNNNTPSNNTPSNGTTNGNGTYAPSTGDASVIAAVASVLSALGFAVSKKRR